MKIILILFAAAVAVTADEEVDRLLTQSNDKFTAKFFTEAVKASPEKSAVLSAYSVLTPLAELALAASGDSQTELFNALSVSDANQLKRVFSEASNKLRSVKGVSLTTANRLYIPDGIEVNDQYSAEISKLFQTDVKNIDFGKSDAAAKQINTWVENHTNKRIKELVHASSFTPQTRAVLVNAIHFKGTWADEFQESKTKPSKFYQTKDKTIEIPFMNRQGSYKYYESDELKSTLLELDYAGHETSFLVVLPNDIDGLAALQEKLQDPSVLPKAIKELSPRTVDVFLPKFKIETTTDLTQVLKNIDIKQIFVPGKANLVNLLKNSDDLFVSDAVQKAFIEVNEKGTEAAAANGFFAVATSALVDFDPKTFRADHPFVFVVKYENVVLFNGVFHN